MPSSSSEATRTSEWMVSLLGGPLLRDPIGSTVALTPMQQNLLTALAASHPRPRAVHSLIDDLWPEGPPSTARAALHNQVSRLRSLTTDRLILSVGEGYVLGVPTDLETVRSTVRQAEVDLRSGRPHDAFSACDNLLTDLRIDTRSDRRFEIERSKDKRFVDVRSELQMLRLEAAIEIGRVRWACTEAEALTNDHPFDESRWHLLVRALRACGRRGDALGAIGRARDLLRCELGISIGESLRVLEQAILSEGSPTPSFDRPFVGREGELRTVDELIAVAESVLLVGDRGIGKSYLLERIRSRSREGKRIVISVRCEQNPAKPVPVLVDVMENLGCSTNESPNLIEEFLDVVSATAQRAPTVLIIDDLHFAGPSTIRALAAAARLPGVSVIGAIDIDASALLDSELQEVCRILELEPFDIDEIRLFLDLEQGPADGRAAWLAEMSGGNPLLAHLIHEENRASLEWKSGTPPSRASLQSLESVVDRRIDRLGEPALRAIEISSLLSDTASRDLIVVLSSRTGLDAAVRAGILVESPSGIMGFRHRAFRQVIADAIPPGRRAELHKHIADHLPDTVPLERARHHLESGAIDLDAATRAVFLAANDSRRVGAHREAAELLHSLRTIAFERSGATSELSIRVSIRLGDCLRLAGDPEHLEILREATRLAITMNDPELISEAALAFVQLGGASNGGPVAFEALAAAELALKHLDGDQKALVCAAMCTTLVLFVDPERARSVFLEAVQHARSEEARRFVLPTALLAIGHPDDLPLRERLSTELIELADASNDSLAAFEGQMLTFSNGLQRGDGIAVRRSLERMGRLVTLTGDIGRRWEHLYCAAAVAHLDGELELAEQLATDAHSLFSPVAADRAGAAYLSQLLMLRFKQSRHGDLVPILEDLVTRQPSMAAWPALLAGAIVEHDPVRGAELASLSLDSGPRDFTWLPRLLIAARVPVIVGDIELAQRFTDRLTPYSGLVAWQGTCAFGLVDSALSALHRTSGDRHSSDHHLALATSLAQRLGAPVFLD